MADKSVFEIDPSGKEWRNIPGFEGIYVVSENAEVKRICAGAGRARKGAILVAGRNPKGYFAVGLMKGGVRKTWFLHTLVCEVFHGKKPSPIHQAAHRDDNKSNNHKSNLYWATPLQNHADRRRNGGILTGSRIGRAKLKEADIPRIFKMRQRGMKCREIGEEFGVAGHTVSRILQGERWGHMDIHNA